MKNTEKGGKKSMITFANTVEIENIADELLKLSSDYKLEIDKLFQRLADVPNYTKEWQGTQANKYFNIIGKDKKEFVNVGLHLEYIAKKLKSDANEINTTINNCNSNESRRGY